jgi:hypothetical protein
VSGLRLVLDATSLVQPLPYADCRCCLTPSGIAAREADAAVAAGINLMLWHEVTAGICQLQVGCVSSYQACPIA